MIQIQICTFFVAGVAAADIHLGFIEDGDGGNFVSRSLNQTIPRNSPAIFPASVADGVGVIETIAIRERSTTAGQEDNLLRARNPRALHYICQRGR